MGEKETNVLCGMNTRMIKRIQSKQKLGLPKML